ncbi:MAG TPA: hypothetical protein VKA68_08285 [bacterium]|nr:hypothetical protein [bacterium]
MNRSQMQTIPHRTVSSLFYAEIADLIAEYVGEEILEHFILIKLQQERYLNSHWDEISIEDGLHSMRKTDFTLLLDIVRSRLSSRPETLLDFHLRAANLCLQYGKQQTADRLLNSISMVNRDPIRHNFLSGTAAMG